MCLGTGECVYVKNLGSAAGGKSLSFLSKKYATIAYCTHFCSFAGEQLSVYI